MHILLFSVRELEFALEMCRRNDTTAAKAGVDRAVAFWIGSLEGTDGAGAGVLSYALAMGRCVDFKTCGDNGDALEGAAAATSKLLESLNSTRASLTIDDCDTATDHVNDAIASMYIPVIQSALLYAHRQDDGNGFETTEKEEGAGAVFASAVLPLVAACNTDDAEIIYETMKNNRDFSVNFSDVKGLFEKNYECLGVTCEDIGGIVRDSARFANANNTGNTTGTVYADGAEPCRNSDIVDKNTTGVPTASPLTTTLPTAERSSMAAPPVAGFIVFPMLFWTCAII